jgi:dTDP-glucose 4,6-dehydratase
LLRLSAGSVCGAHFTPSKPIAEDDPGEPEGDAPAEGLARAKRQAEAELLLASRQPGGPALVFARGFALCGPWLPLDSAFAFGNFLGAAMRGEAVVVGGDGTPVRSYLYAGDMVAWLWTLLLKVSNGRGYNVGSARAVTIGELAHRVAALLGRRVEVVGTAVPGARAHWHVPDLSRAHAELGLEETVPLNDAIVRTAQWWMERRGSRIPGA